eukprot:UN12039
MKPNSPELINRNINHNRNTKDPQWFQNANSHRRHKAVNGFNLLQNAAPTTLNDITIGIP